MLGKMKSYKLQMGMSIGYYFFGKYQNLGIDLPYNKAIPLLDIYLKDSKTIQKAFTYLY